MSTPYTPDPTIPTDQGRVEGGDVQQRHTPERMPIEEGRIVLGVVALLVAIATVTVQFTGTQVAENHMGAVLFGLGALLIVLGGLGLVLRRRR